MDERAFAQAVGVLAARDADLARVVAGFGSPPFWTHPPGFPGLVMSILAQQVSLESARAAMARLEQAACPLCPERFLALDDRALHAIGFSRQKAAYAGGLARAIMDGELDLDALTVAVDDNEVRQRLLALRGVGPWTAECYLLFSLRRPDAWPSGDLALARAIQDLRALAATPNRQEVDRVADRWRPYRAVAARILWHYYLSSRGRSVPV